MPYYRFELIGGERHERSAYAHEFDLRPADYTGHAVVFYKEHPATLEQLRRSHRSTAHGFKVEIKKISKRLYQSG
jgi:hypothetical protein